jgi:hypothetical protein
MIAIPEKVVGIRVELCSECATIAYDPCASCAHGKWGPYVRCEPDEPPLPPMATRALNLTVQSAEELAAIARGVPAIPPEESARRVAICRSNACGKWRTSDETCSMCGCPMTKKAPWRSAICLAGMW